MIYFRYLVVAALVLLALAASVNFIVDPAGIYRSDRNSPTSYANALIASEYGLWWPENSYEDRAIKQELAKYSSQSECVVIGSSHVMQVGSARKTNPLINICSSILNLGVSGASIEDHFTLVYLALKGGHPKKIVLGVDPWEFAFKKDDRWSYYSADYQQARQAIFGDTSVIGKEENGYALRNKLRNLLSVEYTIRSVREVIKDGADRYAAKAAPNLDETVGGDYPILLRDGSLQYSSKYIAQAKRKPIPLGGDLYKTDGVLNDPGAINAYRVLLRWIKRNGIEPIILLTPYHQNVWKAANSQNTRALKATEPIIRQLANELDLTVLGAYDPEAVGCMSAEFFDFMHPMVECIAKHQKHY